MIGGAAAKDPARNLSDAIVLSTLEPSESSHGAELENIVNGRKASPEPTSFILFENWIVCGEMDSMLNCLDLIMVARCRPPPAIVLRASVRHLKS